MDSRVQLFASFLDIVQGVEGNCDLWKAKPSVLKASLELGGGVDREPLRVRPIHSGPGRQRPERTESVLKKRDERRGDFYRQLVEVRHHLSRRWNIDRIQCLERL